VFEATVNAWSESAAGDAQARPPVAADPSAARPFPSG
jgi:hypothetical protein